MIPLRTRRLVILRDQGCRIPGCTVTHHIEVHHIVHWEDDGPTDTWNLIALCPRHHRMHHRGELGITGNADATDGITFTNRHGRVIGTTGARPQPPGAPPTTPTGVYEHPLGERLDPQWLYFNPPTPVYRHHRLLVGEDGRRYAKRDRSVTLAELRAGGLEAGALRVELGF